MNLLRKQFKTLGCFPKSNADQLVRHGKSDARWSSPYTGKNPDSDSPHRPMVVVLRPSRLRNGDMRLFRSLNSARAFVQSTDNSTVMRHWYIRPKERHDQGAAGQAVKLWRRLETVAGFPACKTF
jgi:hypothetical protein